MGRLGATWCRGMGYQDIGTLGDQNTRGWGCWGTRVPREGRADRWGSRVWLKGQVVLSDTALEVVRFELCAPFLMQNEGQLLLLPLLAHSYGVLNAHFAFTPRGERTCSSIQCSAGAPRPRFRWPLIGLGLLPAPPDLCSGLLLLPPLTT